MPWRRDHSAMRLLPHGNFHRVDGDLHDGAAGQILIRQYCRHGVFLEGLAT
ncbi:hypothetical protein [Rhizobium sp. X9]|uniref:hypothetical protein n=1 Tax=Rhizobium sp. X9 TaxID=2815360 RepID=UPI00209AC69D|nr:hypothetical protein [Rhizobium sp. X9]